MTVLRSDYLERGFKILTERFGASERSKASIRSDFMGRANANELSGR